MKKILFAAMMLAAFVGCKNAEKSAAEVVENETVEVEAVVGDVVYVQVEAVLADSEIFKTEGVALRDSIDKWLSITQESDEYKQLYTKYFGKNIYNKHKRINEIQQSDSIERAE